MGRRAEGLNIAVLVIALFLTTVCILMLPGDDVDQRRALSSGEPTGWNETSDEPRTPHAVKGEGMGEPDEVHGDVEGPDEVYEDVEGPVPEDGKKG